jgi:alkylhydroperoxidase family enzyme
MESLPDRWLVRLVRPLLAFSLRRVRRRARPEPLAPGEADGPFAPVVSAFDGLPLARALRRTFDGLWSEGALSTRCKALVFAVVGRALGCPLSEEEAKRILVEGGLAPEEIRPILDHLAAPSLDAVESRVVPFARETVWYQPAHIQQRARALLEDLSRERFVELVATAALANATCRVGFLATAR